MSIAAADFDVSPPKIDGEDDAAARTGNITVKKTEAGLRQKAFWS